MKYRCYTLKEIMNMILNNEDDDKEVVGEDMEDQTESEATYEAETIEDTEATEEPEVSTE
jgi:hypothetical protein